MQKILKQVTTKVILGYLFLALLGTSTVWVIYTEVLQVSGGRDDLNMLNKKIIHLNKILTGLYQAEGLERTYLQTEDPNDYIKYKQLIDSVYGQIEVFSFHSGDSFQKVHTDSIRILLDQKRKNLKELVSIKKIGTSGELYKRAILKLTYNKDSIDYFLQAYKNVIANNDSIYIKQGKKSFLHRLINVFSPPENSDSTLYVSTNKPVYVDSILKSYDPGDSITHYLASVMNELRNESEVIEQHLGKKEQEIIENNQVLTLQLRQILSTIENIEFISSFNELQAIQDGIQKTTVFIMFQGIVALVTIIFFLALIMKDISKSQDYRKELEKAKAYSDMLLRSKEQFMLGITHDLKSPLGSVIGYAGLLRDATDPEQKDHCLKNINKASEFILKMINDLVDYARLESGKLKIENIRFNLNTLIEEIFSGFYPVTSSKKLEFILEYNITVTNEYRGDPVRLKQVLENLISNAVKFTDKGKVTLRAYLIESFDNMDRIAFEVEDTGIGISIKNKDFIFEEFSRVDGNNVKQYEGTGLGLAITKRIVDLLNGKVGFKSLPGKGSIFTVNFPLKKCIAPPERTIPSNLAGKPSLVNSRLLIVDDDELFLDMTADTIQHYGLSVVKSNTSSRALKILGSTKFDAVMTDINMPEMNGFELLSQIRKNEGANFPVIAITGQKDGDPAKFIEKGFTACIYKPFLPGQLLENIQAILGKKQLPDVMGGQPGDMGQPVLHPYTLENIRHFAVDDPEGIERILMSFIEASKKNIQIFSDCMQKKDYKSLSELAHKMLAMFRQLEAISVIGPLSKIENTKTNELTGKQWDKLAQGALNEIKQLIGLICKEQNIPVHHA